MQRVFNRLNFIPAEREEDQYARFISTSTVGCNTANFKILQRVIQDVTDGRVKDTVKAKHTNS